MKLKIKGVFIILFFNLTVFQRLEAQRYILRMDEAVDSSESNVGKNARHYNHSFIGYGFIFGPADQGAASMPFSTRAFVYGSRYKRKLSNIFAFGFDFFYKFQAYRMVQDSLKTVPNALLNDVERMLFHSGVISPYFRINFNKKRGNKLGKYLDLGAYGEFIVAHVLFQKNTLSNGVTTRSRSTNYKYFNRINYGANFRIGGDRLALFGSYRLSDIFYPSLDMPEFSRITLGLQLIIGD